MPTAIARPNLHLQLAKLASVVSGKSANDDNMGSDTSHPTGKADNNTVAPTEGEFAAANSKLVKEQNQAHVESTGDAPAHGERPTAPELDLAQNPAPPGEDSAAENNYNDSLKDPGTTHPARVGEKYGSLNFKQAAAQLKQIAAEGLAQIAAGVSNPNAAAGKTAAAAPAAPGKNAAAPDAADTAAIAGYQLAAVIGLTKEGSQQLVRETAEQLLKEADLAADLFAGAWKRAAEEEIKPEGEEPPPEESGGGAPPAEAAGGPPAGGEPPGLAGLLGGADPGTGAPAGGPPAGPPAGAPPGGAPGGAPGGQPSEEEALMQLAAGLEELGIDLNALASFSSAGAGGAPGGAPPGAPGGGLPPEVAAGGMGDMGGLGGGMPPEAAPPMDMKMAKAVKLRKLASQVIAFKRAGKYRQQEPKTAQERQLRDQMKNYVSELLR